MTMTKREVADYLGVSVRTVEGYIEKKKLHPTLATGVRGKVSVFDEEEVERLKTERGEVVFTPPPKAVTSDTATPAQTALALAGAGRSNALLELINALSNSAASRKHEASVTDLAHKLTLSLDEAARLSGLSRGHLWQAIEEKKLKARIIGRGWRVKRDDLDIYVRKL
jgi:excisionase family DNA binding protein